MRSPKSQTDQIFKLEREVSRLRSNIMRLYDEQGTVGDRYVFSNIPNDTLGQTFVQMMKVYLNDKRHGQGTFTFADGDQYIGEFRNGEFIN